jgi:peptidoglycan/LPS O-acetylase OafA/YrhL
MFGTYRTLLAFGVVAMHLGGTRMMGNFSVFGFYILSGYLMTLITQETYGFSVSGSSRYALNRVLRIYPTYWAAVCLSLLLIMVLGEEMSLKYHDAISLPTDFLQTLKNTFLIFAHDDRPRLVPPAWALTVELFFYACIGLGLSRTRLTSCIWLVCSILYHVVALVMEFRWGLRYFPVYAASLPFATGAVIYHYRDFLGSLVKLRNPTMDSLIPLSVFITVIINWYTGVSLGQAKFLFFYSNLVLCALMVLVLVSRPLLPGIPRSFDKWAGDLSYPVYLIHLQAGMIVFAALGYAGLDYGRMNIRILLIGIPLALIMAWVLTVAVEKPTDKLRAIIKRANA